MTFYLYIKALHIIAVISWMAGMLYLPRLFVYHSNKSNTKEMNETFILMERRLFNYIMRPAMVATWVFGLILVFSAIGAHEMTSVWLITKLFFVLLMTGLHEYFGFCRKALIQDSTKYSQKFFKYINEAPTVLLIIIVILVVVKPYS